jgi:hypothetical protein
VFGRRVIAGKVADGATQPMLITVVIKSAIPKRIAGVKAAGRLLLSAAYWADVFGRRMICMESRG